MKLKLLNTLKNILPYDFRQSMKRKLFNVRDMESRLLNLKRAGFECVGIVDGGANVGEWTRQFWKIFPDVPSMMIEPLPEHAETLRELSGKVDGSSVETVAIGAQEGKAHFRCNDTNSGILSTYDDPGEKVIEVEIKTLFGLLESRQVKPNLLKLDVQGFELEAIKGCGRMLEIFEVIVIEISVLRLGDVPIFTEVDQFLELRNFRLYDLIPQYYRPLDGALWQCDAIYVRKNSGLLKSRDWEKQE